MCDQPHPVFVSQIVRSCLEGEIDSALVAMKRLCDDGYSPLDVITTLFKVVRNYEPMTEWAKLEFIRMIGFTHMRVGDGVNSRLQLSGLLAKLCKAAMKAGQPAPAAKK